MSWWNIILAWMLVPKGFTVSEEKEKEIMMNYINPTPIVENAPNPLITPLPEVAQVDEHGNLVIPTFVQNAEDTGEAEVQATPAQ
jgi:Iap family predicted aminopeptidase